MAQGEPPPMALTELVVDGMNCCTKGVSAGRQRGTAGCKSHTTWLSFFSYLDRNCAKELREIGTYLPLRLVWFLRRFIFGRGAKNSTEVPRGDFSKQIFLPLLKEPLLKLQESRVLALPHHQIRLVPDPCFSAEITQENTAPGDWHMQHSCARTELLILPEKSPQPCCCRAKHPLAP